MMIKEGTGNGTLVKNEPEFWIKAPPPPPLQTLYYFNLINTTVEPV